MWMQGRKMRNKLTKTLIWNVAVYEAALTLHDSAFLLKNKMLFNWWFIKLKIVHIIIAFHHP